MTETETRVEPVVCRHGGPGQERCVLMMAAIVVVVAAAVEYGYVLTTASISSWEVGLAGRYSAA